MPFSDVYRGQVELLIRTLPYVAEENCFALKGGTAINLFFRDLPRSVWSLRIPERPIQISRNWSQDIFHRRPAGGRQVHADRHA